jgi:alpha-mannosidase
VTGRRAISQGKASGWKKEKSKKQKASGKWQVVIYSVLYLLFANDALSQNYIKEWLILGAFPARDQNALMTDVIGGEATARPHGGLATAEKVWRHFHAGANELNFLDAVLDLSPVERAVVYAHVYVQSSRIDTLQLLVGFDEQLAMWVNGQLAHQRAERRNFNFDDDTVRVALQKGWNSVLFKVVNQLGEWSLAARFTGSVNLIAQAETPERLALIARAEPEGIRLRSLELADDLIFSRDNVPLLALQTVLSNPQQQALGDCEARFFAPAGTGSRPKSRSLLSDESRNARSGKQIGREQKFILHAGELKPLHYRVPLSTIVAGFQAAGTWQMRLQFGDYEVRRNVPLRYDSRLLGRIFGTYTVQGIDTLAANGSLEFQRVIHLPKEWTGFPVFLSADLGAAEGTVLINGKEARYKFRGESGDLPLTESAEAGARFEVRIHSTRADSGATQPDWPRLYLTVEHLDLRRYTMTAALLQQYNRGERTAEQEALEEKMWEAMKDGKPKTLQALIADAHSNLPKLPEAAAKLPEVSLVGTSQINTAWLQRYPETIDLTRSVFSQALRHLEKYPDFYFAHGQALSYWWMEQNDPALFESIQKAVREGRWEILGGAWVEGDMNLVSGEAMARQFLYGKRYLKEKFGVEVKTAWMPEVASFAWSAPQVLKKSGMSSFVFYQPDEAMRLFEWEGLEGTRVLSYRPPDQLDSRLTKDVRRTAHQARKDFNWPKALRVYGVGAQSGGPTGFDIRLAEDLASRPVTPTVRMARADRFFEELNSRPPSLAVYREEMAANHSGAWTSQALQKWNNRQSEMLLPAAEAFSLFAQPYGGTYTQAEFTAQWRNVLFNQSHAFMNGMGVAANYEYAQRSYREVIETAKAALDQAMTRIETAINSQSPNTAETPVVVYNALGWPRTDAVEIEIEQQTAKSTAWRAVGAKEQTAKLKSPKGKKEEETVEREVKATPYFRDANGKKLLAQILRQDSTAQGMRYQMLFLPEEVPAFGYKTYWLEWRNEAPKLAARARIDVDSLTMSNSFYSLKIDPERGGLTNWVDYQRNREWIANKPSGLQILGEKGGENSALNFNYDGTSDRLKLIEPPIVLETGPLRARLLTKYKYGNSEIAQEYLVYAMLPRVEMRYRANWAERNKTLKVVYPFQLFDGKLMTEIPFAALERPMNGAEVLMQKWLDLSNEQYGVTIANDSKYGADVQDGVVRVTALRAPDSPDAKADEGEHHFALAINTHNGDWKNGGAAQTGHNFNLPLMARVVQQQNGALPPKHSFVNVEPPRVIVSALKKSEDDADWILRIYESAGQPATATITLPFAAKLVREVDLIEWNAKPLPLTGQKVTVNLGAWEVKTVKISQ